MDTAHVALTFTSDFKLGHYMKIPPRSMFFAQVLCAMIAGTVQLGVQAWMFTNIPCVSTNMTRNRANFRGIEGAFVRLIRKISLYPSHPWCLWMYLIVNLPQFYLSEYRGLWNSVNW